MPEFYYDRQKNEKLKKERGIGFEDVLSLIRIGKYRKVENPNQNKYGGEEAFVVMYDGYPCIIPFVRNGENPGSKAKCNAT